MSKHSRIFLAVLAFAIAAITSCTGAEIDPGDNVVAGRFIGGTAVSVSGPDADDPNAVSIADDMVDGRRFDLTPSGITIASGDVSSEAPAGSDFGIANGTLDVSGDQATVDLGLFSTNPDVDNARMTGTFSLSEASQALVSPGDSFLVDWDVRFDYLGFPVQLDVQQELTGTDFQSLDD
jgi:hypothetical protein